MPLRCLRQQRQIKLRVYGLQKSVLESCEEIDIYAFIAVDALERLHEQIGAAACDMH